MEKTSRRHVLNRAATIALAGGAWSLPIPLLAQGADAGEPHWRTPNELVRLGFGRSRVVMMNEAHSYPRRSIRTRKVGISILADAHESGCRYLAMEALYPHSIAEDANRRRRLPDTLPADVTAFLSQPEMRTLVHDALDFGWTLVPYEADLSEAGTIRDPFEQANWRDEQQGRILSRAFGRLSPDSKLLVWCGMAHLNKVADEAYRPMGFHFAQMSGSPAFAIDQALTVNFSGTPPFGSKIVERYREVLGQYGGTAGFLSGEGAPPLRNLPFADAFIVSTDNEME